MRFLIAACALFVSLVLAPTIALGQGFGINEQAACAMGRGGTGVAEPCPDGSAIYFNPAGIVLEPRMVISGGGTLIFGAGRFTSDQQLVSELDQDIAAPPHAYLLYPLTSKLAVGAGVYVPYGLGTKWPLDFPGRFVSYDARLSTMYVQPTLGYAISDRVSVGGGLTIAISSLELHRRVDLASLPLPLVPGLTFEALVNRGTDIEDTELKASGATGLGGNVGVLVKAHERVWIGARYLTRVKLDYDGDATFTPLPANVVVTKPNVLGLPIGTPLNPFVSLIQATLQNQSVTTDLEMPAQFTAGVSVHAGTRLKLLADYQWVDWSSLEAITLAFSNLIPPDEQLIQNFKDTSGIHTGAQFEVQPGVWINGGYVYNQAAAPDETVTPLLPEARRNHVTAGVTWDVTSHLTLDLAYQLVLQADRRGRIVNPPAGQIPTSALNSGEYSVHSNLLGITLSYRR